MNRETFYAAMFTLGSTATGFTTKSRRLRHIEEMDPVNFPAFYQVQADEDWKHGNGNGNLPAIGQLNLEWWIYVQQPDQSIALTPQLNNALDAITSALGLPPAPPGFKQTLGGLVESVQLAGKIQICEGVLEDRAFARVPLIVKLK